MCKILVFDLLYIQNKLTTVQREPPATVNVVNDEGDHVVATPHEETTEYECSSGAVPQEQEVSQIVDISKVTTCLQSP